jgi:hypothetical protein
MNGPALAEGMDVGAKMLLPASGRSRCIREPRGGAALVPRMLRIPSSLRIRARVPVSRKIRHDNVDVGVVTFRR